MSRGTVLDSLGVVYAILSAGPRPVLAMRYGARRLPATGLTRRRQRNSNNKCTGIATRGGIVLIGELLTLRIGIFHCFVWYWHRDSGTSRTEMNGIAKGGDKFASRK